MSMWDLPGDKYNFKWVIISMNLQVRINLRLKSQT